MAASPDIYDQAAVHVAGTYVVQQTRVAVSYEGTDKVIHLLSGGQGKTMTVAPGGRLMRITWDMVVPSPFASDLLFIRDFYIDTTPVQVGVTLLGSGRTMSSVGFMQDPKLEAAVKTNLLFSCSWVGEPAEFA